MQPDGTSITITNGVISSTGSGTTLNGLIVGPVGSNTGGSGNFSGAVTAAQLQGVFSVDGTTYTTLASAYAAAVAAGGNQKILLPPGNYNMAAQIVEPATNCIDIYGNGSANTSITVTSNLAAPLIYNGNAAPSSFCHIEGVSIYLNKNATYGVDLRGWAFPIIRDVKIYDATVALAKFGDYVGWNSSNVAISTLTRSGSTVTINTSTTTTNTLTNGYVVISGASPSSFNGVCSTFAVVTTSQFTCTLAGADTSGTGGSMNTSASGVGFSSAILEDLYGTYQPANWTQGSQPNYGAIFYPTATDTLQNSGLDFTAALVANFELFGSTLKFAQLSCHNGYGGSALSGSYCIEHAGGHTMIDMVESDEPIAAAIHLTATSNEFNAALVLHQMVAAHNTIPIAIIENGAQTYTISNAQCSGGGTLSALWQFNGGATPNTASHLGFTTNCYTSGASPSYWGTGDVTNVITPSYLTWENLADSAININLIGGATAAQSIIQNWEGNASGTLTTYWQTEMTASGAAWTLYDDKNGRVILQANTNGNVVLNSEGSTTLKLQSSSNSGTGGVGVYSGGSGTPTFVGGINIGNSGTFSEVLTTPSSSAATCTAGQFTDDANYHYVCTATNTWKRVALTTF